jgi:hypothetical protein
MSTTSNSRNYSKNNKHTHINVMDLRGVIKNKKNLRKEDKIKSKNNFNNYHNKRLPYSNHFQNLNNKPNTKESLIFKNYKILNNIFYHSNKKVKSNTLGSALTDETVIIKEGKGYLSENEEEYFEDEDIDEKESLKNKVNLVKDFEKKYLKKQITQNIINLPLLSQTTKNKNSKLIKNEYLTYNPNKNTPKQNFNLDLISLVQYNLQNSKK